MYEKLKNIKEYYASGYYEEPQKSYFCRFSRGIRRYLENREMPQYNGELLYPCGSFATEQCVQFNYSYTVNIVTDKMELKDPELTKLVTEEFSCYEPLIPQEHAVGGGMYTHSFPNYPRIEKEGLSSYLKRVENMENADLKEGLIDVIEGIRAFHSRCLEVLIENHADTPLYKALKKVPFNPPETLYEAIVCRNFIYYMDGCDNIGHLDEDLIGYYQGEDMTEVFRELFKNIDANDGWSGALGPKYNPLTIQCLKASKGMRRPSIELRTTPEMPDDVWNAAIESISAGGGSPSLYNEKGYQDSLAAFFPEIPEKDRMRFCGGGCTETMLTGISNVGSLDAGINLALIFENYMQEELGTATDFNGFYNSFIKKCHEVIHRILDCVNESQKLREKYRPQPMRTLLIDDCIEKEKDFNNCGARYRWSVINLAGLINVLDSMLVIQQLVFTDKIMTGEEMLQKLSAGETFLGYPGVPRHGTDSTEANNMAKCLSADICSAFEEKTPYSGGKFLPSSIQFVTYLNAGKTIGATPDGRSANSPLCDSIGAIHGNDKCGPTALLNSAAALCQSKMAGTPILNIKLDATQATHYLKALVNSYFEKGGMQLQVTCINKDDLIDAQKNPQKHPNLIVRIGGYSEYFNRLSPELQQTVINRTLHGM